MRRLFSLVLTVLLLACTPAPTGSPAAPSVAEQEVSLKIGFVPVVDTLPLYVAERMGWYTQAKLRVELVPFRSAVERETALLTGQIDGEYTDMILAILMNKDEQKGQIVSTLIRSTLTQPRFFTVVGANSGITDLKGLRGKDVATARNTIIDYATDSLLAAEGLKETDINKTEVAAIPLRLELLSKGQVAAATLPEPFRSIAVTDGAKVIADDGKTQLFTGVMVFSTQALKDKAAGIRRFLAAVNEASSTINAKPADWASTLYETANVPPPARDKLAVPRFPKLDSPTRAEYDAVQKWLLDKKTLDKATDYGKTVTTEYLPK